MGRVQNQICRLSSDQVFSRICCLIKSLKSLEKNNVKNINAPKRKRVKQTKENRESLIQILYKNSTKEIYTQYTPYI